MTDNMKFRFIAGRHVRDRPRPIREEHKELQLLQAAFDGLLKEANLNFSFGAEDLAALDASESTPEPEPLKDTAKSDLANVFLDKKATAVWVQLWSQGARASRHWICWTVDNTKNSKLSNQYKQYLADSSSGGLRGTLNQELLEAENFAPFEFGLNLENAAEDAATHERHSQPLIKQLEASGGNFGYSMFFPHLRTPGALVFHTQDRVDNDKIQHIYLHAALAFSHVVHELEMRAASKLFEKLEILFGGTPAEAGRVNVLLEALHALEAQEPQQRLLAKPETWQMYLRKAAKLAQRVAEAPRFLSLHNPSSSKQVYVWQKQFDSAVDKLTDFPTINQFDLDRIFPMLLEALRNAVRYHDWTAYRVGPEIKATGDGLEITNEVPSWLLATPAKLTKFDKISEIFRVDGIVPPLTLLEQAGTGFLVNRWCLDAVKSVQLELGATEGHKYVWKLKVGKEGR